MLNNTDAVDVANQIFRNQRQAEKRRLDRIARSLQVADPFSSDVSPSNQARGLYPIDGCGVNVPPDAPPAMRSLARKSRSNYLALIVDDYAAGLYAEGYRSANQTENAKPWASWQANGMDARQGGIYRHALAFGVSYAVVLPGEPKPVIRGKSPRKLTALYDDPVDDDWPVYALEVITDQTRTFEGSSWKLYDDEAVYTIDRTDTGRRMDDAGPMEHGLGVCPVVRFRDRVGLEGDPMGIIEPLIPVQARIDETTFGLLVAQHYAAFKQRYIVGWVPDSEAEMMKASASSVWTFQDGPDKVRLGEFTESDLSKYIESGDAARRDLAAISQLPLHNFAVGAIANLSAEALAAMEAAKDRRTSEMKAALGEANEQMLRLSARAENDNAAADDFSAQIRWADRTARSLAQTVDALGKAAQMLGIPEQALWPRVPNTSDQDLAEWKRLKAEEPAEPDPEPPAPTPPVE